MKIRHIKHQQIDFVKWDLAIDKSSAALVYAYAWYLDSITNRQWDALVVGDYEAVFPLPFKKKFGLKYVYQPYFCQQLGLFAPLHFKLNTQSFLKAIPWHFFWIEYAGQSLPWGAQQGSKTEQLSIEFISIL